jgi:hypothetical protein
MRSVCEMRSQLPAGPDDFGSTRQFRYLGDERKIADQFAAAAEISCGRDADDIGRCLPQVSFRGLKSSAARCI